VGSFPTILKFDSLGQHFYIDIYYCFLSINFYIFIFLKFFKQKNNIVFKKSIPFNNNIFFSKTLIFFKKIKYIFPSKILKSVLCLLSSLIYSGINFLLLDNNYNYNYLPVSNVFVSKKKIYKTIKYHNIKVLFFLDLKPRIVKKFFDLNLLNINTNENIKNDIMCFYTKNKNLKILHYIFYIYILSIYNRN
jgi:hypothetical protein